MKIQKRTLALAVALASVAANVHAIDFTPLSSPATLAETNQATSPFKLSPGWTQTFVVDADTLTAQFATKGQVYPSTFRAFDMIDFGGSNNEFIYIPHEVQQGAGMTRYNRVTGEADILLQGNNTGTFSSTPGTWSSTSDDFGALDPAVVSPTGSLLTGEEWAGNGRLFEMSNPTTATGTTDANWTWLSKIPSVSHEGLKFDSQGNLYFIDEDNSGSIYKYTPKNAGDLSVGQTFVLKVDAYAGDASKTFNNAANVGQARTGAATWTAVTDADGNALTSADPFNYTARGGRAAADELAATPYGRPEDLAVGHLADGTEVLYLATTSENAVYSIALDSAGTATVREFMNALSTENSNGNPIGVSGSSSVYGMRSPDNLEVGPDGTVFIIEDQNPGDIWAAVDSDGDGVADLIDLFASLGPFGSEPTGFIVDPNDPNSYYVSIQHPSDDNDALWKISKTAAPVPVPAAAWLLLSGIAGLVGISRRSKNA